MAGCLMVWTASADDFDVMRSRLRDYVVLGQTADIASCTLPEMRQYITSLSSTADGYRQTMRKDTTFLWTDVALLKGSKSYTPAHINESYVRLLTLARAWAYPGTKQYADEAVLADIRYGLDVLYREAYSERSSMIGNWWEWRIGVPWSYAGIVSILYEHLTPAEIVCFEKSTAKYVRSFVRNGDLTYANQASLCRNLLAIGVLTNNATDVENALRYVVPAFESAPTPAQRVAANRRQDVAIRRQRPYNRVSVLENKEGLYADGSFVQHTAIPYIGTYGTEIIAMAGYMACVIPGTRFEVPKAIVDVLPIWINNAYLPAMYRGEMMFNLMGRANDGDPCSNARQVAISIMDAARLIPDSAERSSAIRAASNSIAHSPHYASPYANMAPLPLYKRVIDEALSQADGAGQEEAFSVVWAAADRVIHQTPSWRFALSMSSNRIGKYECFIRATGRQNTTGWYMGDGMTSLYLPSDPKQYIKYIPNVDPYRLPGTTVDLIGRDEVQSVQPIYGHRSAAADVARAGGVTLRGSYSAAAMQLLGGASDLTAKKAWFMFDNEVVCLGTDINLPDDREVITTIENRRFSPSLTCVPNENQAWGAYLKGVGGYIFPEPTALSVSRDNGNTALWLSHGKAPKDASYSYIILPVMSNAEVSAYHNDPDVAILSNTASLQAVQEQRLGILSAVFWEAGSVRANDLPALRANAPAAVMMQAEGDSLYLSVSDPTWDQQKQTIVLEGRYQLLSSPGNVRILEQSRWLPYTYLEVDQRNSLGMTSEILLLKEE